MTVWDWYIDIHRNFSLSAGIGIMPTLIDDDDAFPSLAKSHKTLLGMLRKVPLHYFKFILIRGKEKKL